MIVGEVFLSAFVGMLFMRLTSPEFINIIRQLGVRKKVEKWRETLGKLKKVLRDAEEKQLTDMAIKVWLDDLRNLAYDVEDILDEFDTKAFYCKSKPQNLFIARLSPRDLKFHARMFYKMKKVTSRFKGISGQATKLGLDQSISSRSQSTRTWARTPSTCLAIQPDPGIYGREEEKRKILELLLRDADNDGEDVGANYEVIAIVGMAGVGKTALAQLVYNDKAVCNFHRKMWVHVTQDFDVKRIAKAILECITFQPCHFTEFNQVQVKLREALAGQRFLLVLDDVWNKDYSLWEALKSPFGAGASGSKIIVTTRCIDAALTMSTLSEYHTLKLLPDDYIWQVFLNHAFEGRKVQHPQFRLIREKVVENCKGLPLTARSLGGLLRSKPKEWWLNILTRKMWDLPGDSDILPVLRLSYHNLPSHLKRCFAYCAVLPKGYEFEEEELLLLWMAEGLVPYHEDVKQMEELAGDCFQELVSMSIFQVSSSNKYLYVMHDLIHDLARWAAGETCFCLEDLPDANSHTRKLQVVRHFSYIRHDYDGIRKFEAIKEARHTLRTFLPFRHGDTSYITTVFLVLLPRLKRLRVLSLSGYNISEIPDSIGELKHLRHIDLSWTLIRSLPESTTSLHNLLTLILTGCSYLSKLPKKMENLIKLQYLDLTDAYLLSEMPPGISKLTSLRKLSDFFVRKDSGCGIEELMNLNFLRGRLCISNLENVTNARRARQANLSGKQDLSSLVLKWNPDFSDSRNEATEKDILDMLQPPAGLKELTINGYAGTGFPSWVADQRFSNMVFLRLENCENCISLPSLGLLQSLKDVVIVGMSSVQSIGPEFYGAGCSTPFPSLETLHLENMPEWQQWHGCEGEQRQIFPRLQELSILGCPELVGNLPDRLPLLEILVIHGCQRLSVSISGFPMLLGIDISECEVVCARVTEFNSLSSIILSLASVNFLVEGSMEGLTKVENLEIVRCEELTSFTNNQGGLLRHLNSLKSLRIKSCSQLVSLVIEEAVEQEQIGLPCSLEILKLLDCETIEQPIALCSLTSLRELHIENIHGLVEFKTNSWPSTLQKLYVSDCTNLRCLLEEGKDINFSCVSLLEHLYVRYCPSLQSLSSRSKLPNAIKHLEILECQELESIADTFDSNISIEHIEIRHCRKLGHLPKGLEELNHLQEMIIFNCPNIVHFPEGGLSATSLRRIYAGRCEKLESLPEQLQRFTSLQELEIHDCPNIKSFPQVGFPSSLTTLSVTNPSICKHLFSWGLHRLTCLKELFITGGCSEMIIFPEEKPEMMLPPSLTSLSIADFPSLKYLSSQGFQNLSSLQELSISDCPKLKGLPEKGLPATMLELYIHGCPLLKKKCMRHKGQEFSKIEHIPFVYVDNKFIYDPEEES